MSVICDYCRKGFEARSQGRKQRFCPGGSCRRAFESEARKVGNQALKRRRKRSRRPLFEDEIVKPENQARIAEILAWAEDLEPGTWDIGPERSDVI